MSAPGAGGLKDLLSEASAREERARKRAWLLTLVPLAAGLVWMVVSFQVARKMEGRSNELRQRVANDSATLAIRHVELDSLNREIAYRAKALDSVLTLQAKVPKHVADRRAPDSLAAYTQAPEGRLSATLRLALELKDKGYQFTWGGKSPEKGFDSSGFVAYVLSRQGLLASPQSYWSGALREKFAAGAPSPKGRPAVGDLVFYPGGYCAFYLGEDRVLGMIQGAIQIVDLHWAEVEAYGRVNYQAS